MKSIVLCERTLVQESEDFKNYKEEKISEENNVREEANNVINGTSDGKKSEAQAPNPEKDGVVIQNGDRKCSKTSFEEEASENDGDKRLSGAESPDRENVLSDNRDSTAENENNSACNEIKELEYSLKTSESETLENLDVQNGSADIKDSNLNNEMDISVENDETSEDTVQVIKSEKTEYSSHDTNEESLTPVTDTNLADAESKENVQPLDDIVLDLDENKENEKEEKTIALDDFSESDLSDKHSSGCEIQVGKVETISGAEKESMWAENDCKKSQKDSTEDSVEKLMDECQDISMSNEDSMNIIEEGKEEEINEFVSIGHSGFDTEENLEDRLHIDLEESDQAEEGKIEEKEDSEQKDLNDIFINESENNEENISKAESGSSCRKRQVFESSDEDPTSKKRKLSEEKDDEPEQVQLEEENTEDSSRCASLSSLDSTNPVSAAGQVSDETEVQSNTERSLTDDKKLNASTTNEDAPVEKQENGETMFSVLEKFRGTLKTLTRSDLEELIIQKLCEVITERSNVGELRQKAQALEQEHERWKTKYQSLTKQMREMEMVMKKYMSEVQKQIKEGDTHVVTPLKVTRSVGLQVSFYSSANKVPKPNSTQPVPPGPSPNAKNFKGSSSQFSPVSQNTRNKTAPPVQKTSPSLQKSPLNQQKRTPVKPDYSSPASNRVVAQQSLLNNNRGGIQTPAQAQAQAQAQVQALRPGFKSLGSPQQHPQQKQQLPQNQQQQQSGSKVIDLTEDDDRQPGNIVKTSGPIRVVNHLTQPTPPQNNKFAYLLPTSPATGPTAGQNRQVLIATPQLPQPNRQIMCSMPPLFFKGGNVVQGGSQTQMLNQSNKVVLPKTLRHPAPLPQRPINQNTKPSLKLLPPRPALKISKVQTGIVLSWNMSLSPEHAPIASYQLYAYQESDSLPTTSLWKKVGDVKALPLPMACTLTQFMSGHKYHFAVRAVDLHSRIGPFSFPGTIVLV